METQTIDKFTQMEFVGNCPINEILLQKVIATAYARVVIDYFHCSEIVDDLFEIHNELVKASGTNTCYINEIDYFKQIADSDVCEGEVYLKKVDYSNFEQVAKANEFTFIHINHSFFMETNLDFLAISELKKIKPTAIINEIVNYTFISKSLITPFYVPKSNKIVI